MTTFLTETLRGVEERANVSLREAFEKRRLVDKARNLNSSLAANTAAYLGECLTELGRYEEAEEVLRKAYSDLETLRKKTDRGAWITQVATQRLVALYEVWGKPDEADKWRAKLLQGTSP